MTDRNSCVRCGIPLNGTARLHESPSCEDCLAQPNRSRKEEAEQGFDGFVSRLEKAVRRFTGPLNQPDEP